MADRIRLTSHDPRHGGRRTCSRASLVAATLALVLVSQPSSAQEIRGRVVEEGTDAPVAAATVLLRTVDGERLASAESDDDGRFVLHAPDPGRYLVYASRLDYMSRLSAPVEVAEGERAGPVVLRLVARPMRLDSVEVTVDRDRWWLERAGFYRRMESGIGHYITREEIEEHNPRALSDLMRPIPGVRVVSRGTRGTFIVMRRAMQSRIGPACLPAVYLDGLPMDQRALEAGDLILDDALDPRDIEAIEVYQGAAAAPAQYGTNPCGTILVWLRR